MEEKKDIPVRVDVILPGELYDEDPEPRAPAPVNEELEEHYRKSIESWLIKADFVRVDEC